MEYTPCWSLFSKRHASCTSRYHKHPAWAVVSISETSSEPPLRPWLASHPGVFQSSQHWHKHTDQWSGSVWTVRLNPWLHVSAPCASDFNKHGAARSSPWCSLGRHNDNYAPLVCKGTRTVFGLIFSGGEGESGGVKPSLGSPMHSL